MLSKTAQYSQPVFYSVNSCKLCESSMFSACILLYIHVLCESPVFPACISTLYTGRGCMQRCNRTQGYGLWCFCMNHWLRQQVQTRQRVQENAGRAPGLQLGVFNYRYRGSTHLTGKPYKEVDDSVSVLLVQGPVWIGDLRLPSLALAISRHCTVTGRSLHPQGGRAGGRWVWLLVGGWVLIHQVTLGTCT